MKKYIYNTILLGAFFVLFSCTDLDMVPLSQGSSEDWYSSKLELEMALNDGYRMYNWEWAIDKSVGDKYKWDDDWVMRTTLRDVAKGTLNGQNTEINTMWSTRYQVIAHMNLIFANMDKAEELGLSEADILQYTAEASFIRACAYMTLVTHWGDIPYYTTPISIDEAFEMGRTPVIEIKPQIYADFDMAIDGLPVSYDNSKKHRATKGAALAMKARCALYLGDYALAAEAAKACMDLDVYELHADFGDLFLMNTRNAEESIFYIPRSLELGDAITGNPVRNFLTRNAGGTNYYNPSWQLLASFLCTDGLPIDESPLFDPHDPFKNRDPRCSMTIIPFGSEHLGFEYDPHPKAIEVMNYNTGEMVKNNDSRINNQYASFNALGYKKGVDENYMENGYSIDPDLIIIRYADVLLIYAEAKIELGEIDQTVLDAINEVRARAYGVDKSATTEYPAITSTVQKELRKTIRFERRMEFAYEGFRYMDLIRWKLAKKAFSDNNYAPLYPYPDSKLDKWFWDKVPEIDEDGLADFSEMEEAGDILILSEENWDDRQYLFPIPTSDILINPNLEQNPGY